MTESKASSAIQIKSMGNKIFFYCNPSGSPEKAAYQHAIVCLGEGLKSLNIPFFSNINYWRSHVNKEHYLFSSEAEISPDDCSVVVLNNVWFDYHKELPNNLFHKGRKYITVFFDMSDGSRSVAWEPEFRKFDFIFKSHYNQKFQYPSNFYPWAFGLSNRILAELKHVLEFNEREKKILVNFRPVGPHHSVRTYASEKILPKLQSVLEIDSSVDQAESFPLDPYNYLQWSQSGRRHYPHYYQRLQKTTACACFGGYFVSPLIRDQSSLVARLMKRLISRKRLTTDRIMQWDSWRLWESFAAGCLTFHMDFKKYGFLLPEMPENWKHYVGISSDNIAEAISIIAHEPELIERVATTGRDWALEHYSPVPTARRFLETIGSAYSNLSIEVSNKS